MRKITILCLLLTAFFTSDLMAQEGPNPLTESMLWKKLPGGDYLTIVRTRVPIGEGVRADETIWLLKEKDQVRFLGASFLNEGDAYGMVLPDAYGLHPSPDGLYLAVYAETEGANWIEIIDLEALVKKHKYVRIDQIMPFPGLVYAKGWDNGNLLVESTIALEPLNENKKPTESDKFDGKKVLYEYSIFEKTFKRK